MPFPFAWLEVPSQPKIPEAYSSWKNPPDPTEEERAAPKDLHDNWRPTRPSELKRFEGVSEESSERVTRALVDRDPRGLSDQERDEYGVRRMLKDEEEAKMEDRRKWVADMQAREAEEEMEGNAGDAET